MASTVPDNWEISVGLFLPNVPVSSMLSVSPVTPSISTTFVPLATTSSVLLSFSAKLPGFSDSTLGRV